MFKINVILVIEVLHSVLYFQKAKPHLAMLNAMYEKRVKLNNGDPYKRLNTAVHSIYLELISTKSYIISIFSDPSLTCFI